MCFKHVSIARFLAFCGILCDSIFFTCYGNDLRQDRNLRRRMTWNTSGIKSEVSYKTTMACKCQLICSGINCNRPLAWVQSPNLRIDISRVPCSFFICQRKVKRKYIFFPCCHQIPACKDLETSGFFLEGTSGRSWKEEMDKGKLK